MPYVIKGVNVTSYYTMFLNSGVTKVVSTNPNITNMMGAFYYGTAYSLDLSDFNTSNVTNMSQMFANNITTVLNLKNFNTAKVENMSGMFFMNDATVLDLSSFVLSSVSNTNNMFANALATTGYAKSSVEAGLFNSTANKPVWLTFTVK